MNFKTTCKIETIQKNGGFTLIEVVIAIGIFAIGFLAVGLMQISAMNTTNSARQNTEAMSLAENQAERLRSLPFYDTAADLDGLNGVEPYDILPDLTAGDHTAPADNTPYTARWNIVYNQPLPAYPANVLDIQPVPRSMTIRVWVTRDGEPADAEPQAEIQFAKLYAMDF